MEWFANLFFTAEGVPSGPVRSRLVRGGPRTLIYPDLDLMLKKNTTHLVFAPVRLLVIIVAAAAAPAAVAAAAAAAAGPSGPNPRLNTGVHVCQAQQFLGNAPHECHGVFRGVEGDWLVGAVHLLALWCWENGRACGERLSRVRGRGEEGRFKIFIVKKRETSKT